MRATLFSLLITAAASSVAAAPAVSLSIHDGHVDLSAMGASVADILNEWARVGATHVENGERLPRSQVTLQLQNVTEAQALDVLLRSAAGFIAVPRRTAAAAGASQFERILILATSTAPPVPPAVPAAPPVFAAPAPTRAAPAGTARVLGPDGRAVADDQEGAPAATAPPRSMPPGFSAPPAAPPVPPQVPAPSPVPATSPAPAAPSGGAAVPGTIVKQPETQRRPGWD